MHQPFLAIGFAVTLFQDYRQATSAVPSTPFAAWIAVVAPAPVPEEAVWPLGPPSPPDPPEPPEHSKPQFKGLQLRHTARPIMAFIPAHNEQATIAAAVESLRAQSGDICVTVVADNCTDGTVGVARALGCRTIESVGNAGRKAGALNQALDRFLGECPPDGLVLVMDADTVLGPEFLSSALRALEDSSVGAVGGIFRGLETGRGLWAWMQANEYDRYARQVGRRQGKAFVLTGTATVFRVAVLKELVATRGYIYETRRRTEDNEVTLAIRHLGYQALSPKSCIVRTELMPDLPRLWRQRYRWYRGAVEDLRRYGWTPVTAPYIVRQGMLVLSVMMTVFYLVLMTVFHSFRLVGPWPLLAAWVAVTAIFVTERFWTVRRGGPRAMALAALLIPEMLYALVLHAVYVSALFGAFAFPNSERRW